MRFGVVECHSQIQIAGVGRLSQDAAEPGEQEDSVLVGKGAKMSG